MKIDDELLRTILWIKDQDPKGANWFLPGLLDLEGPETSESKKQCMKEWRQKVTDHHIYMLKLLDSLEEKLNTSSKKDYKKYFTTKYVRNGKV